MKNTYKLFKIEQKDLKILTPDERKILNILIEACKKLDAIFRLQDNDKFLGANFYPHDTSKEGIENSAKKNLRILDPFTVVQKDKEGQLTAIDYHIKYQSNLKPIANLINKASQISKNQSFKNYLQILSVSVLSGEYDKADIAWLSIKNSDLDFTLGPFEKDLDRLFGVKKSYQAHVGIILKERSRKAKSIKDILYLNPGPRVHHIRQSNVEIQVQNAVILAGFSAEALFVREHLPTNHAIRERYGSRIIGYLTSIDYKFEKLIYPIYNSIFENKFKERYSKDVLRNGNYYHVLFFSLAKQLHEYPDVEERLKELTPIFQHANNIVSGIQHSKHLILKGVIDQKELEAIMITQICWIFSEWVINKTIKAREPYLKGDSLALNFLVESGALQEKDGISWPNFAKMFFEIENLSSLFSRFLEDASYSEAHEFLDKHLSLKIFEAFDTRLSKIKPL